MSKGAQKDKDAREYYIAEVTKAAFCREQQSRRQIKTRLY